jgi:RNA polymerase sigma-70 factor (ECF subfamily)
LDHLRTRRSRHEDPASDVLPELVVNAIGDATDPEAEVLLGDSVGLALLVVLETLSGAERLAFVLHDMFAVPFEEIAPIVGRTPAATRQLASRARRRVQGSPVPSDADAATQRELVQAFLAASRSGDFDALLAILDPQVVLHVATKRSGIPTQRRPPVSGADAVARTVLARARNAQLGQQALIDGRTGIALTLEGDPIVAVRFQWMQGRALRIDLVADLDGLERLRAQR